MIDVTLTVLPLIVLSFMVVGCSGGAPVEPTTPGGAGCLLGPIALPGDIPGPCSVRPQCPRTLRAGARPLVLVSACGFGADADSCTPVPTPMCPMVSEEVVAMRLLLYDPNKPGSVCTAVIHLRIEVRGVDETRIFWDAQEFEDAEDGGCRTVGPEHEGGFTVNGPCCAERVDIHLPISKRTSRISVQTDWADNSQIPRIVSGDSPLEFRVPVNH
jgi:hypothetical protein